MSLRSRTIKLFCPSLSKLVPYVAIEDHRLDLGTIARTFGLEPATLRLNGHFLSRGADLISSVTWKSLLSFFATRGFSTGKDDRDALLVDGKLCNPEERVGLQNYSFDNRNGGDHQVTEENGLGIKRKPRLEDVSLSKKRKIDESKSGKQTNLSNIIRCTQFAYSCTGESLKHPRENEMVFSPCKRCG